MWIFYIWKNVLCLINNFHYLNTVTKQALMENIDEGCIILLTFLGLDFPPTRFSKNKKNNNKISSAHVIDPQNHTRKQKIITSDLKSPWLFCDGSNAS